MKKYLIALGIILAFGIAYVVFASSSGPLSPQTIVDDASIGTVAWSEPMNASTSDNAYAAVEGTGVAYLTHYLKATNFGFSIPTGATINGIMVEREEKAPATNVATYSYSYVKIVKGGVIGTYNNHHTPSSGGTFQTSDTYASFPTTGGNTDLWGTTWTAEDINNSGFGAAANVWITAGLSAGQFAQVDHIRITVYYTLGNAQHVQIKSGKLSLPTGHLYIK